MIRIRMILAMAIFPLGGAAMAQENPAATDFRTLCAPCHGLDAQGHGPAAATLPVPPADLTRISSRHGGIFPSEQIFDTIAGLNMLRSHGTREMPVWGDVFVGEAVGKSVAIADAAKASHAAEARITRLVDYLKTLQRN
jgi:hypothetical protein